MDEITKESFPQSSDAWPRLDLAHLEKSLARLAHYPVRLHDRRRVVQAARSVIDALEGRMPRSVVRERREALIFTAKGAVK